MNAAFVVRWAAAVVAISVSAASTAQAPVFVEVEAQALGSVPASAGKAERIGQGVERAAPIVMETRGHVHTDGSVSTTCAAIASSVPHSVAATRPITKQQER